MNGVTSLGYIGLGVSDRTIWRDYAEGVLGLSFAGEGSDGAHLYRMDELSRRILLHEDACDDILYAGFEAADANALTDIASRLEAAGVDVQQATADERKARAVADFIWFKDPDGLRLEVFCGATRVFDQPFRPRRAMSGFVTGEQGLGHIVLTTTNLEKSVAFYRDLLGFRISDYINITLTPDMVADFAFLRCNPRHHTVALAPLPLPKRLQHLMVQTQNLDDVGFGYDLAVERGTPIIIELGRHSNDHMVSFYMTTPSGFEAEYGWGARTVDERSWRVERHETPSTWGHKQNF